MNILYLAAEATPFIKVGGLADVAGSLPASLRNLSLAPDIRVILPLHRGVDRAKYSLIKLLEFPLLMDDREIPVLVYQLADSWAYFIEGAPISDAEDVYSSNTSVDGDKYSFFSLAALEFVKRIDWQPDILHANDWHTAPAVYAISQTLDPFFKDTKTLITIHNLVYLGTEAGKSMQTIRRPPSHSAALPKWAREMPLPLALLTADKISTVSEGYAKEILSEEFGVGLHPFLRTRKKDIYGILNGLDQDRWDPLQDKHILQRYSRETLDLRSANKRDLQETFDLKVDSEIPLLTVVSRMDPQKGIDLLLGAFEKLKSKSWQAILLGTGDPAIETAARELQDRMPDRVRTVIDFDAVLARKLYAGADAIMIPSRYEPCGLTQMIGMRYGCIPVARATGGLRDTIIDVRAGKDATGFLYQKSSVDALAKTLHRMLKVFSDQNAWHSLQQTAMSQDYSWEKSAQEYMSLYQNLLIEN